VPLTTDHSTDAVERAYRIAAAAKDQAALCLSGGGLRPAILGCVITITAKEEWL